MTALAALFLTAFAAATFLPLPSEPALVALLLTGEYATWLLVAVASIGNVLGSTVNWAIGRGVVRFGGDRLARLERAQAWYHRYGKWSLLLSWVPLIGDPLTVVAGLMREPLLVFLAIVAVAKTGRYVAVAATTLSVI